MAILTAATKATAVVEIDSFTGPADETIAVGACVRIDTTDGQVTNANGQRC